MSLQLNKAIIAGNLGRDPEIRNMQNGDPVANLAIATNKSWTDKQSGEKKTRTEWHRVVIFGGLVKVVEQYLTKGSGVYIEGELQTREWTNKEGNKQYSTEIVLNQANGILRFTDNTGKSGGSSGSENYSNASQGGETPDLDDDIPF